MYEKPNLGMNPVLPMPSPLPERRSDLARTRNVQGPSVAGTVVTLLATGLTGHGVPSNEPPDLIA